MIIDYIYSKNLSFGYIKIIYLYQDTSPVITLGKSSNSCYKCSSSLCLRLHSYNLFTLRGFGHIAPSEMLAKSSSYCYKYSRYYICRPQGTLIKFIYIKVLLATLPHPKR